MTLRIGDRVRETSVTPGTGAYALGGAWPGFRTVASVLSVNDTGYFTITDGTSWEIILGTLTAPTTLARTTILSSSSGGSPINWVGAGPRDIFSAVPSSVIVNAIRQPGEFASFPKDPGTAVVARGGIGTGNELYVECDGSIYNISLFPALGAFLAATFGGNGTTTFGMPNTTGTGRFLRSRSGSTTIGTTQANQNLSHTHTGSTIVNTVGTISGQTQAETTDHAHGWGSNEPVGSGQGVFTTNLNSTSGYNLDHQHPYSDFHTVFVGGAGFQSGAGLILSVTDDSRTTGFNSTSGYSLDHQHTGQVGGVTGGRSAAHVHNLAGSGAQSTLNSNALAIATTDSGGAEARPESFIVMMCLKT